MKYLLVILLIGVLLHGFTPAAAQQGAKAPPRVGIILSTGTATEPSAISDAFKLGLQDLGYVDGKNISIERRFAEGRLDRMQAFVNEFVQQKFDVILAPNNVAIRAAKQASKTIPIVMISSLDPVAAGYVESFARPGGNITGLAWLVRDLSAKRVEILKELLPKLSRVGALWDADGPGPAVAVKEYEEAARAFKLEFRSLPIRGPNPDFVGAFQSAKTARLDALLVVANPLMAQHAKEVFELAAKQRIPSMTEEARFIPTGGLISYGASLTHLHRRAAEYVAEILKGANPGDLPVKLASKFDIFINLKTAQQLGIVVPQHLLVQADKVVK